MITATDVELRAGPRLLLSRANLRVGPGDRIGLVGRNGAGKTTLTRVLSGETQPAGGTVTRSGSIGYLPQDSRVGDLTQTGFERVLSARDLDVVTTRMRECELAMASDDEAVRDAAMERYPRLEARFTAAGGYAAEAEASAIAANLALGDRVLGQTLDTLSGGQRRRVELARILFSDASVLLLDEPTNHLDADSISWLRENLKSYSGGLVIISHDVELLDVVVNRVVHLDANRGVLDTYNVGWSTYLKARATDEERRRRERSIAEKKAGVLFAQADKMRAKATKAVAAQNMAKRAERMLAGSESTRRADRVARLRFPDPSACGRTPLTAEALSKSYGSLEIFAGVDLAVDRGAKVVVLGLNGAGKTTLLRLLAGVETPDAGEVLPGHGLKLGYYAQEHETIDPERSVLSNMVTSAPHLDDTGVRSVLGSFLFVGDDVHKPAGVLSGGEKTRLALAMLVVSAANVLLLDEPTNNLDPASRAEVLDALRRYAGAVILVTHDEGAVTALEPQKVVLLPDGVEDHWTPDYAELVSLA